MQLDQNGIYVTDLKKSISYPDSGNKDSFEIERNSFWFNHRNDVIRQVLLKYPHEGNFADIGGGNGYQAAFIKNNFPGKKVFLVEPGYEGCLNAKVYGVENIYNVLSQDFDFKGNNVGGVGMFDVLEHIDDDAGFLKELSASLPKGSLIYITVPAYQFLWSETDDYGGHFRRFNSKMVKNLARKSGLKYIFSSYFMSYLTLPIYLSRALPYKIRGKRENEAILESEIKDHNQSSLSKGVLRMLNAFEIGAIRNFGRIFSGGSIIFILKTP